MANVFTTPNEPQPVHIKPILPSKVRKKRKKKRRKKKSMKK